LTEARPHLARASVAADPPEQPDCTEPLEPAFEAIYVKCRPFTMTGRARMYALWQAINYTRGLPGSFVECGVWRGGSSMLADLTLREAAVPRPIWMYDTYEGMPPPGPDDVDWIGMSPLDDWDAIKAEDGNVFACASLDDVKASIRSVGLDVSMIKFVAGRVEDTIPATMPDEIAVLRLDTDWYESTLHELRHLWPRLVSGGVLIVDDYGHWQGARKAVDEFFAGRPDAPMLTRIDYTGRIALKV